MSPVSWTRDVPFLKNTYIFRSILLWYLATILVTSILMVLISVFGGFFDELPQLAGPFALVFLFLFVLIIFSTMIVVGWKYPLEYLIDEKGFLITGSRKRAQAFRWMAIAAGVLARNPGLTGTGMLIRDNVIFIPWSDADNIRIDKKGNRVIVEASFWKQVALHYPEDLERRIEEIISNYKKQ